MKTTIAIEPSSLRTCSRRMISFYVILVFACQSILHAEIQKSSFEFDGRLRNYMVYLPTNYTGTINFPLVIYLHCYGATAQWGMNYTQLNQVADASDFIVVYPSAIPNWNSGIADNPSYPTPNVDDVGFINALIDIMNNHYSIDIERIYACGYSNGGIMSYKLACQLSNRIAAIACVGGGMTPSTAASCSPLHTMPVLHIHGTADPYALINGGTGFCSVDQTLSYWINFNDCVQIDTTILPDLDPTDGCTVEKITYTDCSDNCSVVYYKVINGGHTWPGATPLAMGNTNQDIDASVEIWNFFKNYKLITRPVVHLNGDGKVDFRDFCILAQYWHQGQSPFSHHRVDFEYLAVLAEDWLVEFGLVAHWKLDETAGGIAHDSIAGKDAFGPPDLLWRPEDGKVGGALELDGIDDLLFTTFSLNPADRPFSVFVWVKGGASGQVIISQSGGANWLMADASEGKLMTELQGTGRFDGPLYSQTVITDGAWHRVGLTWDGSNRILYVDDVEVARDTQAGLAGSNGGFYFGAGKIPVPPSLWLGLIDDIRIYDRAIVP